LMPSSGSPYANTSSAFKLAQCAKHRCTSEFQLQHTTSPCEM